MEIDEKELTGRLKKARNVLLVEPPYNRKYPPLGLAKAATYLQRQGAKVTFSRGSVSGGFDLVCISSLFTFDSAAVLRTIRENKFLNPKVPAVVGGVFATLVSRLIPDDVMVFRGYSKELDLCVPNLSMDWEVEDPWDQFSYVFTTRGCPNRCPYCAVWRLEPEQWICPNFRDHIQESKPNVMISDNNLSSFPMEHIESVVKAVNSKGKRAMFDNGFDCKHITEDMAKLLAKLRFARIGMRLAFDRIEEDGVFQKAVATLIEAGVSKGNIMAYVLFNFLDTPQEANYRMRECRRMGIRPYPQQYEPLGELSRDKKYIGKAWTSNLLRAFRHYWLMAGIHTKMSFEKFAGGDSCRLPMTDRDWAAWEAGGKFTGRAGGRRSRRTT